MMRNPYGPLPQNVNDRHERPLAAIMVDETVILAAPNTKGQKFLDNDMECVVVWSGHRDNGELLGEA